MAGRFHRNTHPAPPTAIYTPIPAPTDTPTPSGPKLKRSDYRVRTDAEALSEWLKFRRSENKYSGSITTWKIKVSGFAEECPYGYLAGELNRHVLINGPDGETYQAGSLLGDVPTVKEGDWIVITGRFQNITEDNYVVLEPIKVKNEGYK